MNVEPQARHIDPRIGGPCADRRRQPSPRRGSAWAWSAPAIALVSFAGIIPLAVLVHQVFDASSVTTTLRRPSVVDAFRFSAWQALWSTAATMVVGATMAWVLSRYEFRGRRLVHGLMTIPFVLPTVVVASAFLALLPSSIERSFASILLAHVFFNVSVVVRLVAPAWSVLDDTVLFAARTLGASPTRIATRIVLVVGAPALKSAAALVFLMSFTSFGVVRILGGARSATVEVEIYRRAVLFGDVAGASVLSILQLLVVVAVFGLASRGRSTEYLRVATARRPAPVAVKIIAIGVSGLIAMPLAAMILRSMFSNGAWTATGWSALFGFEHSPRFDLDLPAVVSRSLVFAIASAAIAVPAGVAAAIGLARSDARSLRIFFVIPLATSAVAVGLGILVTYDSHPFDFRSATWLIPVVHSVVALPFVVRVALPVVQSIPQGLRDAAAVLGASPARRWRTVDVPLLRPALATALGLSSALSLGEFGATSFLTRRSTETLPIVIDQLLSRAGDAAFTTAMASSTFLLLLTGCAVAVFDSTLRT